MVKRIVWTKPALEDKLEILIYFNKRNKSNVYSKKLNQIFKETIKLVRDQPSLARETENPRVKYILTRDYLIFLRLHSPKSLLCIYGIQEETLVN